MVLKKIYRKKNKRLEWALVSMETGRPLQYFGIRKPSRKRFLAAEKRVQYFKRVQHFKRFGSSPWIVKVRAHSRRGTKGVKAHIREIKYPLYAGIMKMAQKKGLEIPKGGKGKAPLAYDEADIPEKFLIDGFTIPIEDAQKAWGKKASKQKGNYLVIMDDDAPKQDKKLSFAHELAHVHMFESKEKPHTERKAERYAAKIFGITDKEYDKMSQHLVFDQNVNKPGIQLPKTIPKKKEVKK